MKNGFAVTKILWRKQLFSRKKYFGVSNYFRVKNILAYKFLVKKYCCKQLW